MRASIPHITAYFDLLFLHHTVAKGGVGLGPDYDAQRDANARAVPLYVFDYYPSSVF